MRYPLSMFAAAVLGAAALLGAGSAPGGAPANPMSFFVTSANPGKGADFGGLAGADRHCQALASAAGAGGRTWRAYLSALAESGAPAVHARDRIGNGPWRNAKGVVIAANVEELHGANNNLNKQTALNEKGEMVGGGGDPVNMHDILTGSGPDGRASTVAGDSTCGNWTKSGEGSAIVGHHDRRGLDDSAAAKSWNSSHATPGCSPDALKRVGGAGLLYCFATN
jgi:hypothetical protein